MRKLTLFTFAILLFLTSCSFGRVEKDVGGTHILKLNAASGDTIYIESSGQRAEEYTDMVVSQSNIIVSTEEVDKVKATTQYCTLTANDGMTMNLYSDSNNALTDGLCAILENIDFDGGLDE